MCHSSDISLFAFPVVREEQFAPAIDDSNIGGIPDWAIAVIVIGLGSLAFVLVFGITVVSWHCQCVPDSASTSRSKWGP